MVRSSSLKSFSVGSLELIVVVFVTVALLL
jgi:hypothetical protein